MKLLCYKIFILLIIKIMVDEIQEVHLVHWRDLRGKMSDLQPGWKTKIINPAT